MTVSFVKPTFIRQCAVLIVGSLEYCHVADVCALHLVLLGRGLTSIFVLIVAPFLERKTSAGPSMLFSPKHPCRGNDVFGGATSNCKLDYVGPLLFLELRCLIRKNTSIGMSFFLLFTASHGSQVKGLSLGIEFLKQTPILQDLLTLLSSSTLKFFYFLACYSRKLFTKIIPQASLEDSSTTACATSKSSMRSPNSKISYCSLFGVVVATSIKHLLHGQRCCWNIKKT